MVRPLRVGDGPAAELDRALDEGQEDVALVLGAGSGDGEQDLAALAGEVGDHEVAADPNLVGEEEAQRGLVHRQDVHLLDAAVHEDQPPVAGGDQGDLGGRVVVEQHAVTAAVDIDRPGRCGAVRVHLREAGL